MVLLVGENLGCCCWLRETWGAVAGCGKLGVLFLVKGNLGCCFWLRETWGAVVG